MDQEISGVQNPGRIESVLQKKSKKSILYVVLDDFDEIHRDSRAALLNSIYKSISNSSLEKAHFIVLSRADALVDQQAVNELYELEGESNGTVEIEVARIKPFTSKLKKEKKEEYDLYIEDAIKWGARDNIELAKKNYQAVRNIRKETINEFLAWVDGANAVFEFMAGEFEDDEKKFIEYMQGAWYRRAQKTHSFPDLIKAPEYMERAAILLPEIHPGGDVYRDKYRPLLFTGLIEIVPVKLSQGNVRIRAQFPSLVDWYSNNATQTLKSGLSALAPVTFVDLADAQTERYDYRNR